MFGKIKQLFLLVLLAVTVISYLDVFNSYDSVSSSLSNYVLILTGICFLLNFNINCLSNKYIKTTFIFLIIIVLNAAITTSFFNTSTYFNDLRNVAIPFIAVCIGYNMNFNRKFLMFTYFMYGILLLAVSASLISNNIGGLVIVDTYQIASKNALGVMISSYVAIVLPLLLVDNIKRPIKYFFIALCAMFFIVLLTIRARASTMTFFFTIAIFIFEVLRHGGETHSRAARKIVIIGVLLLLAIPILSTVFEPLGTYIHNSLFQNVEDDVTTGRMDRNVVAINFISDHPFFGRLTTPASYSWIHNYVLRVLAEYGIFFSAILIILYFYLVIKVLVRILRKNPLSANCIGYWALLPPIMLSLIEPLFPYGPGTSVLLAYILLGYSLKQEATGCFEW